jgi:hypothetical protein
LSAALLAASLAGGTPALPERRVNGYPQLAKDKGKIKCYTPLSMLRKLKENRAMQHEIMLAWLLNEF